MNNVVTPYQLSLGERPDNTLMQPNTICCLLEWHAPGEPLRNNWVLISTRSNQQRCRLLAKSKQAAKSQTRTWKHVGRDGHCCRWRLYDWSSQQCSGSTNAHAIQHASCNTIRTIARLLLAALIGGAFCAGAAPTAAAGCTKQPARLPWRRTVVHCATEPSCCNHSVSTWQSASPASRSGNAL